MRDGTVIYNTEGGNVSGTSYVLLVDATMYYLHEEHLPYTISAILIWVSLFLTPL